MSMLLDTDVLIDYLKGHPQALDYLLNAEESLAMSTITLAELYSGVREGVEREALTSLADLFDIVPLSEDMAVKAGLFRRDYRKSHNLGLMDTLIAATSVVVGVPLVTLNHKHFPMLPDLIVPYQKP